MGLGPMQVGQSMYWHFMAAMDGYGRANGWEQTNSSGEAMSDQRLAELGIEGF